MVTTAAFTVLLVLYLISKERAPMDLPLTSGVASFPFYACVGFIDSGVLIVVIHVLVNAFDRAYSHI